MPGCRGSSAAVPHLLFDPQLYDKHLRRADQPSADSREQGTTYSLLPEQAVPNTLPLMHTVVEPSQMMKVYSDPESVYAV